MTYPRLRLAVATCLFLGWIGFLAYLVWRTRDPVVLSRPQFLHAQLVVLVELESAGDGPAARARVKETLWSRAGVKQPPPGEVLELAEVVDVGPEQGWRGPRDYIVALTMSKDAYHLTTLPRSPGFLPRVQLELVDLGPSPKEALDWIARNTRLSVDEAKKASPREPRVLLRNLGSKELIAAEEDLQKLKVAVQRRPGEYRIYAATPDALEQCRRITD